MAAPPGASADRAPGPAAGRHHGPHPRGGRPTSESLRIELRKGDRQFASHPLRRPQALGDAGTILDHRMDSRQSRRRSPWSNARPRVDAWRADAERAGEAGLPENRIVLVPAEAFPLACTARGLQEVYLDVHLHPTADGEIIPDPDGRPAGPSRRTHGMPPG